MRLSTILLFLLSSMKLFSQDPIDITVELRTHQYFFNLEDQDVEKIGEELGNDLVYEIDVLDLLDNTEYNVVFRADNTPCINGPITAEHTFFSKTYYFSGEDTQIPSYEITVTAYEADNDGSRNFEASKTFSVTQTKMKQSVFNGFYFGQGQKCVGATGTFEENGRILRDAESGIRKCNSIATNAEYQFRIGAYGTGSVNCPSQGIDPIFLEDVKCEEQLYSYATTDFTSHNNTCDINEWTYYYNIDEIGANQLLFAIKKGTSDIDFVPTISKIEAADDIVSVTQENVGYTYLINKFWDVESPSVFEDPVSVRFFFEEDLLSVLQDSADKIEASFDEGVFESSSIIPFKTYEGEKFDIATNVYSGGLNDVREFKSSEHHYGETLGLHYLQLDEVYSFSGGGLAIHVATSGNVLDTEDLEKELVFQLEANSVMIANPNNGELNNIKADKQETLQLSVYNLSGQSVYKETVQTNESFLFPEYISGLNLVQVTSLDGEPIASKKILFQ